MIKDEQSNKRIYDLLDKVMELYFAAQGVVISKTTIKGTKVYDSVTTNIYKDQNKLFFEFDEEEFRIKVSDIKDITFETVQHTTISILQLENGEVIAIHNL